MTPTFVVLGCATSPEGQPSPALRRRLEHALLTAEPRTEFLVTGGAVTGAQESRVMRRWLEERGVIPARIFEEPAARSTVENALLCVPLLRARDVHTLFLVTERYHMRRAARVFRAAAPEIVVVPNPAPDTVVGLRRLRRMGIEQLKLARDLAYIARLSARAS